ncbi:hypothetical protein D3C87_1741620 [compost metagenome]
MSEMVVFGVEAGAGGGGIAADEDMRAAAHVLRLDHHLVESRIPEILERLIRMLEEAGAS